MWRIAWRYLWGGKRYAAVNVITAVSVGGVALATAAIIIVLSVFNGFRQLAQQQLSVVDPDVRVTPSQGAVIYNADSLVAVINGVDGVREATAMVEQRALVVGERSQTPVRWRGVDADTYARITGIDSVIIDGLWLPGAAMASVGVALDADLRPGSGMALYVPRRLGRITPANAHLAFRGDTLMLGGVVRTGQQDYDADMVYLPIDEGRALLDYYDGEATSIEVSATDPGRALNNLRQRLGEQYVVTPREQLQTDTFRMIAVEKWITFAMLAFILLVASFNIISTVVMLVIEKRHDTFTLRALGAGPSDVYAVFMWQGRYIALGGCVIGMLIGCGLTLAQQWGHFIGLGATPGTTAVDYYPVQLLGTDVALVAAISILVSLLATRIALRIAKP